MTPFARRLATALFAALIAGPAAADADPDAARATAATLVEGAHTALADDELAEDERDARLREAVADAFAFDLWGRYLLGDRADMLSGEQKATFEARLPGFLAHLYKSRFGAGLSEKPVIRDTRPARTDVLVRASIPREDAEPLPVDWRIRDFGEEGHKVIDVMVGGVSFLVLKREEFQDILKSGGPDALLAYMERNSL